MEHRNYVDTFKLPGEDGNDQSILIYLTAMSEGLTGGPGALQWAQSGDDGNLKLQVTAASPCPGSLWPR